MEGLEMKYFVLKPRAKNKNDIYAYASQQAIEAYSKAVRSKNALLADQLFAWATMERVKQDKLSE